MPNQIKSDGHNGSYWFIKLPKPREGLPVLNASSGSRYIIP